MMKKTYTKPLIEIEAYELSGAIAYNCSNVVNVGPGIPGSKEDKYRQCSDFGDSGLLSLNPGVSLNSTGNVPFYSDGAKNCDCYYTSGGQGYFTS